MKIVIDGKDARLGRLASYVAKQALKGEEIIVLNCEQIIISGGKKDIEKNFKEKRSRFGSSQKGPKHSKNSEKIVKRAIRGMIPEHRWGRGKQALKRIKCYSQTPREFQEIKAIKAGKEKPIKFLNVKNISK